MHRSVRINVENAPPAILASVQSEVNAMKAAHPNWDLFVSQVSPVKLGEQPPVDIAIIVTEVSDGWDDAVQRVYEYGIPVTAVIAIGGTEEALMRLHNWCLGVGVEISCLPSASAPMKGFGKTLADALLLKDSSPRVCGNIVTLGGATRSDTLPLTVVVLGASGDLAKKKTFPALIRLFFDGLLHHVHIVGYARSPLTREKVLESVRPYIHRDVTDCVLKAFFELTTFVAGSYTDVKDFAALDGAVRALEGKAGGNRLFYLALPPNVFRDACHGIRSAAMAPNGWTRVIVEKPFGRDLESSNALSSSLGALLNENQIFRIDHYLGKEMVQNMVTLRFANKVFSSVWNCDNIANVQITFKETIGTEGRGGYFDTFGIIRDVIQNHLTQLFALVAMEKPRTLNAEQIRDEKVALLQQVLPINPQECVLGQYTASPDGKTPGYLDDPTVPKGSLCPTFAYIVLRVRNDRWRNVPFIFKAGKALDTKAVTVRIQFHEELVPFGDATRRNELVVRAQPDEAMYLKITTKRPGNGNEVQQSELDLSYKERFATRLPDAYESLIYEAIKGNTTNFVRSDELEAAWRIFTPLLHAIDRGDMKPYPYPAGSRGPPQADEMTRRLGYTRSDDYRWSKMA